MWLLCSPNLKEYNKFHPPNLTQFNSMTQNGLDVVKKLVTKTVKRIGPDPPKVACRATSPGYRFADLEASKLSYSPLEVKDQPPVPKLANKLDRVLFSPGIHFLKDPRTNVYNFDSQLEKIMSITDFDFSKIPPYVPAGRDGKLSKLAKDLNKVYTGSTSSLTSVLTQMHHAISHHRPPQILNLPKYFPGNLTNFSVVQRAPTQLWLVSNPVTETYAVSMAASNDEIILTLLGQAMEAMLTTESSEFVKWAKNHPKNREVKPQTTSTYNYTTCGKFLMRSQLDCYDPRLPGTGMFDLKTRACCAVRHDMDFAQIRDGTDYQIRKLSGQYESFAREYYELVRSALFKYSLQARIGRMDGIFVAYHSVRKLFGFEYIPLSEIDKVYHTAHLVPSEMKSMVASKDHEEIDTRLGNVASKIADKEFTLSIELLSRIFDYLLSHVKGDLPDLDLVFHSDTPGSLIIFARRSVHNQQDEKALDVPYQGFRVTLTQSVDNKFIATNKYPALIDGTETWRVSANIVKISNEEALRKYRDTQKLFRKLELVTQPITDKVLTPEEQAELLAKLPKATSFQQLLRKYDRIGSEYSKWDDLREKIRL